jgi:glycosyltransferase involved in cell wall biosynthesis
MKVCVIGTAINPVPTDAPWSGIESLVTYLVKGLVELGQEVTLVSVQGSLWRGWDRIELVEVPVQGPDLEKSFFEGYRGFVKDFPGVVHDHSNGKLARTVNPRTLGTMHWLQDPGAMGYKNVVCISEAHRKWTLATTAYALDSLRTCFRCFPDVVYNGVDPSLFPFQQEKGDEFLFFSVMGEYKGADTILELAKAHPEYKFGFGGRNTTFTETVKKAATEHENITFYGEVSHDEKKLIMGRARALLQLPKPFDPRAQYPFMDIFPMTIIEANLCGTPVIGLAVDGVIEMIEQYSNGVLCYDLREVEDTMAGFVEGIVSIPPERCREYAEKRFSYLRMARDYIRLYEKILNNETW